MKYSDYNLRELLELALRVPEIGAVNFNILYVILKTILCVQNVENIKPMPENEEEANNIESKLHSLEEETPLGKDDTNIETTVTDFHIQSLISDVRSLKTSRAELESQYVSLEEDFGTVVDSYGQYGLQLEDLEENVERLLHSEENLGKLKTRVQRLEDYVFTGTLDEPYTHISATKSSIPSTVPFPTKIPTGTEFYLGTRKSEDEVEVPLQQVHSVEGYLKKADIEELSPIMKPKKAILAQKESEEVRRLRSPKEKFKELTKLVQFVSGKGQPSAYDKYENAEEFKVHDSKLKDTAEILPVEGILPSHGVKKRSLRQIRQFPKAAHAVINIRKVQTGKQANYLDTELFDEDNKDIEIKVEKETKSEPSKAVKTVEAGTSIDLPGEIPLKEVEEYQTILLFEILEENTKKLKEELVVYIKKQVNPILSEFYLVESDVTGLKIKIKDLKLQVKEILNQLTVKDSYLQDGNKKLSALENIVEDHDRFIKDALEKLDRKAESDEMKRKAEKKDVIAIEKTLSSLCDVSTSNITALENMIKECVTMLRRDLHDRLLLADFDVYSEPLENKIKKLERMIKAKSPDFHNIRQIEIKKYVHGEKQNNMPQKIELPFSPEVVKSSAFAINEMKIPIYIQTEVKKKMENAQIRGCPHLVDGNHTKIDFRKRNFK